MLGVALMLFALPELVTPRNDGNSVSRTPDGKTKVREQFCLPSLSPAPDYLSIFQALNGSQPSLENGRVKCDNEYSSDSFVPPLIFCVAQFLLGIGATTPWVLGLPFIDDNVRNKNSALYFGKKDKFA